ncbi:hypothetical protein FQR65_LT15503 [Abscondita terminalis]|nr:hypothetical protein FQR65_LT15503 [Abscondita terminalis]
METHSSYFGYHYYLGNYFYTCGLPIFPFCLKKFLLHGSYFPKLTSYMLDYDIYDAAITEIIEKSRYEEANNIEWNLINEFRIINGYKTQKATTRKYGRNWTAWYSKDIPFPFGPYKFNKLPGLIVEVYDENKDYFFSMYSFRKRKYYCKSANMMVNAKLVPKSKVFDYQKRDITDFSTFDGIITDPETLQELTKMAKIKAQYYNPLELLIE